MNRSPSASNIYRHHTPPKESPQSHSNGGGALGDNSDFVVHRSKGITTLFNMQDPLIPAKLRQAKEKTNTDSKSDERGEHFLISKNSESSCAKPWYTHLLRKTNTLQISSGSCFWTMRIELIIQSSNL